MDVAQFTDEDVQKGKEINEKLVMAFAWNWALSNKLILPDGNFVSKGREYLWEPMVSDSQCEVTMKGTQAGFTLAETLTNVHGCIYGKYPKGVIYCMPTDSDVQTLSKTKWNPLIAENTAIGRYVQSGGKGGTDSADLKKIGRSYIYFLTAMLKRGASGEKTSSTLKSRPCDKFVCDEFDEMDPDVLEKLRGRSADSEIKQERIISNPLSENSGSHKLFIQSTQRLWHRLCPHCMKYTCPDEEFFIRPEKIITPACTRGMIHCIHCGKLTPMFYFDKKSGKSSGYVPKYTDDRKWIGRHWSHLNSVRSNAWDILQDFQNPPEGNLGDVMRNKLGRPYTSKEDQLKDSDVRACCSREPMLYGHNGPCIMGVDVMKIIHYCIGSRVSRETYEIFKAGTCQDFKELYDIAKRFNVRTAGIDVAPDIHAAKTFQTDLKTIGCKAFLVDYRASRAVGGYGIDEVNNIIKANRTEAMDMTHNMVMQKQIILPRSDLCEEFIKQICDPFKIQTKNEKTGLPEFRYKGSADHYRHGLNYMVLAGKCGNAKISANKFNKHTPKDCVSDYKIF
jgi:hypothetical protein